MHGWWVLMGAVIVTAVAIAPRLLRHHRRRVQVDRVTEALSTWLPALKQPDDTTVLDSPDRGRALPLSRACAVRPRRRVVLSANDLSTTLAPGWRMQ